MTVFFFLGKLPDDLRAGLSAIASGRKWVVVQALNQMSEISDGDMVIAISSDEAELVWLESSLDSHPRVIGFVGEAAIAVRHQWGVLRLDQAPPHVAYKLQVLLQTSWPRGVPKEMFHLTPA